MLVLWFLGLPRIRLAGLGPLAGGAFVAASVLAAPGPSAPTCSP